MYYIQNMKIFLIKNSNIWSHLIQYFAWRNPNLFIMREFKSSYLYVAKLTDYSIFPQKTWILYSWNNLHFPPSAIFLTDPIAFNLITSSRRASTLIGWNVLHKEVKLWNACWFHVTVMSCSILIICSTFLASSMAHLVV